MLSQMERMQQLLEAAPYLLRIGQPFSEFVLLRVDDNEYYLTFEKRHLVQILRDPSKEPLYCFAVHTDADALARFWDYRTAPGFHDIIGLVKIGSMRNTVPIGGAPRRIYFEKSEWIPDIKLVTKMPPHALRHFYVHSDVHSDVESHDLADENSAASVSFKDQTHFCSADASKLGAWSTWNAANARDAGSLLAGLPASLGSSWPEDKGS